MLLFDIDKIENTEIDIYFKYDYLDTNELTELLSRLDRLYKILLDNSFPVYFSEKYGQPFRNFLEIESINTGQSIRIRFKEGWKPEFRVRKKDLEINIPIKLGIPAIVLYFLLTGAQKITSMRNDYLDGQLKELELKLKQMELYEKMEDTERYRSPFPSRTYQRQATEMMNFIINNQNINFIEINGTVVKDEQ
ncbi:MAG: hypothetical protein WCJ62_05970 [Flavobacterium sp.]